MHNQNSLYLPLIDKSSLCVKKYLAWKFDINSNYYKVICDIVGSLRFHSFGFG